jgi:hypothetical protein
MAVSKKGKMGADLRQQRSRRRKTAPLVAPKQAHAFVDELFGEDMHAARVVSLANAATGAIHSAALGIHAIGRGLAAVKGLVDKHAVKQVDRCIGNEAIDVDVVMASWTRQVVAGLDEVWVNIDWTEFDRDDHSTLVLSVQTNHGRSMPLMWKTVRKSTIAGKRNDIEEALILRFREAVPTDVRVVLVGDRGFGDQRFYSWLPEELNFDYVLRIRSDILVTSKTGECRPAAQWVGKGGRLRSLDAALVTKDESGVGRFIAVQNKAMADAWCLVVSSVEWPASEVKKRYGKRFSCEETFRDVKDLRYGLGMKWNRIRKPERRDRLMLVATLAIALLTLLGTAGEACGLDRLLKTNTSTKRTMSLFRQGLRWYELIPNMPVGRLKKLMKAYDRTLREHLFFGPLMRIDGK